MGISIDPEFQAAMFPLGDEERQQLEANILAEGCREPLTLWRGLLLDGHNRHAICSRYDLPFATVEVELADRAAALDWIDRNQLGRRNLTPDQMRTLRGRRYNREKKAEGRPEKLAQNDPVKSVPQSTAERHAREAGVSPATIKRDGAAVAKIEKSPELTKAVQAGTLSLNLAAKAAEVLTPEQQIEVLANAPGKLGEAMRAEVAKVVEKVEKKKKDTQEWNAFVDKAHAALRPEGFDRAEENRRVGLTHDLYNSMALLAAMPPVEEMLPLIPDYQDYRFEDLDAAISWFNAFAKAYKESRNERVGKSA